jgi:hypothetical protein
MPEFTLAVTGGMLGDMKKYAQFCSLCCNGWILLIVTHGSARKRNSKNSKLHASAQSENCSPALVRACNGGSTTPVMDFTGDCQ